MSLESLPIYLEHEHRKLVLITKIVVATQDFSLNFTSFVLQVMHLLAADNEQSQYIDPTELEAVLLIICRNHLLPDHLDQETSWTLEISRTLRGLRNHGYFSSSINGYRLSSLKPSQISPASS